MVSDLDIYGQVLHKHSVLALHLTPVWVRQLPSQLLISTPLASGLLSAIRALQLVDRTHN